MAIISSLPQWVNGTDKPGCHWQDYRIDGAPCIHVNSQGDKIWTGFCCNIGHRTETHLELKSRSSRTPISVVKSFWKFAENTAVILPCSVQNFKAISPAIIPSNKLWSKISRDSFRTSNSVRFSILKWVAVASAWVAVMKRPIDWRLAFCIFLLSGLKKGLKHLVRPTHSIVRTSKINSFQRPFHPRASMPKGCYRCLRLAVCPSVNITLPAQ